MIKNNIKLGMEVKDKVSGLHGIATSLTIFLFGCRRIGVSRQELKSDGTPYDEIVLDEPQLEILSTGLSQESEEHIKNKTKPTYGNPDFIPTRRMLSKNGRK